MQRPSVAASVREAIRARISAGTWRGQLPPEPELARQLRASRETVRRALAALEAAGLVYRVHGRGTFVEEAVSFNPVSGALSITEEMARTGLPLENEVREAAPLPARRIASAFVRAAFGDAEVLRVVRLRRSRGKALALETSYFRAADFPGLLDADLSGSLHRLMTERYGLSADRVRNRLEAADLRRAADRAVARALGSRAVVRIERELSRRRHAYYAVDFCLRTDVYPVEFLQLPDRSGGGFP
jgi:GntR family transcriptional regulator